MDVRRDCLHFRGDIPCRPHKARGVHCDGCPEYVEREGRILIVKIGAAGDVIRTTPLLVPLRRDYPRHRITWITRFPDLLPPEVDDPRPFDTATILWVRHVEFDLLLNLDKDREACALANEVDAREKRGFRLGEDGFCEPADGGPAAAKFLTGVFDDVNLSNRLSYLQEIFAISGYAFAGEGYLLDRSAPAPAFELPHEGPVVGLNTGCGGRWTSRLWPEDSWAALARALIDDGCCPLLLGGPEEHEKNRRLAEATGAFYPGVYPLKFFTAVMDRCEVVVTAVTLAMHLAIGLQKQLVLINNIFNPAEFELYGRGEIVQPERPCACFFQPTCTQPEFCLDSLAPETVLAAVRRRLEAR